MLMRTVETTKRQMIREVMQSNLENRARNTRNRRIRWQMLRWGAWGSLLAVTAALAIFSVEISRRKAWSSVAINERAVNRRSEQQSAETPVPSVPPSDVNLSVLPLSVKKI